MAKKEKAEEKEKEGGDGGGGERDEEMEDVRDSSAGGGGGFAIRDKWMLCHDITPLAMDILTSKGVSVCFLQHQSLKIDTPATCYVT